MTNTARIALCATGPALTVSERAEAAGFVRLTWGHQGFCDAYNGIPARNFSSIASDAARTAYWSGYQAGQSA